MGEGDTPDFRCTQLIEGFGLEFSIPGCLVGGGGGRKICRDFFGDIKTI